MEIFILNRTVCTVEKQSSLKVEFICRKLDNFKDITTMPTDNLLSHLECNVS